MRNGLIKSEKMPKLKRTSNFFNFILYLLAIAAAVFILTLFFSKEQPQENQDKSKTQSANMAKQYSKIPEMTIDPGKIYKADVSTSYGNFQIELFAENTPVTVNNFVVLGQVVKGMEVIDKIAGVEVEDNGLGEQSKPKEKVIIENITVSES